MQEFEIIEVSAQEMPEQLGTKEKYWLKNKEFLFKIGRKGTLENCAEIIAGQIAKLINLPCAEYGFALYKNGQEKQGVLSRNFLQNSHLVLGNELLAKFFEGYDMGQKYKARNYTLRKVLALLLILEKKFKLKTTLGMSPLKVFVGYLIFDALIANQDRHHENWGVMINGDFLLAPSFDHASGIASKVSEEEAKNRLTTKDKNQNIDFFCQKAITPFYKNGKKLKTFEVVDDLLKDQYAKKGAIFWIDKIQSIDWQVIEYVLNRIPSKFALGENQKQFILKMLKINAQKLKELKEKQ